jgi:hypothetical protein
MSSPKELHYFNNPQPDRPLAWYYDHFRPGADHRHRGESSVSYTMFPTIRGVPERIHAMDPDIRLVYIVREPVSRMLSAYAQMRYMGFEYQPIEVALTQNLVYTATSMYALQLSEYLRWFDPDQIHVEDMADLAADPMAVLGRVADFLEIPCDGHPVSPRNPRRSLAVRRPYRPMLEAFRKRDLVGLRWQRRVQRSPVGSRRLHPEELRISPELEEDLRRVFAADVAALEDLLKRSFAHWNTTSSITS